MISHALAYPIVVPDASIWAGHYLAVDAFHAASDQWLAQYSAAGGKMLAPDLLLGSVNQ